MRIARRVLAVTLALLLAAPAAQAQTHVINKAALAKAVAERANEDQRDREAIVALLQRAEVRGIAEHAGLSIDRAVSAVSLLEGDDLRELASTARQAQNDLAGGASTVVISTTTVIIVLLLIIILILIAD